MFIISESRSLIKKLELKENSYEAFVQPEYLGVMGFPQNLIYRCNE